MVGSRRLMDHIRERWNFEATFYENDSRVKNQVGNFEYSSSEKSKQTPLEKETIERGIQTMYEKGQMWKTQKFFLQCCKPILSYRDIFFEHNVTQS